MGRNNRWQGEYRMSTIRRDLIERRLVVAEYREYTRFLVGSGVE